MRLIIIRHADAEDYAGSDFQRNLTAKGRKQAAKIGNFLSSISDLNKSLLVYSPYLRAAQTADIIMKDSAHYYTAIEDTRLGCGMSLNVALEVIAELAFEDTVIMVGHQPDLGELICYLLGTNALTVHVKKGTVAVFEIESLRSGGGVLQSFIPVKCMK